MARRYYTLAIREDGRWAPQFGDFDREVVADERRDSYEYAKAKDVKIIATAPGQADIDAAIAKLNA